MAYTTIDKPTDYFNTVIWTGNGSTQSITGVGFQPDWTWIKHRNGTGWHSLYDVIRGATKSIYTNRTDTEGTYASSLTSFDSDGFSLGNNGDVNGSTRTYVGWNWLAGGTASSNTDGSITSSVSANTTAGFSIVSYTGNATAGATVGHGLGVKPSMMIIKTRESAGNWVVFHGTQPATKYIELNNTGALGTSTAPFNDTEPTSSVFTLGTWSNTNDNGNGMIAYCFAEKKGFSKFGSYEGNGNSDGTFVYTGFKPAFVITKRADTGGDNWHILDNKRDIDNPAEEVISANADTAEGTTSTSFIDFLSNGFKCRGTGSSINTSGLTYVYIAFAENPFVTSGGIPTTAR